jgi:glutathione S-transferase
LTFVDFLMYEMLDEHKVLEPKILEGYPALEKFQERIESLPRIAKYIKSPRFIKYPLNNRMASFGG